MANKIILYGAEARNALKKGVDAVADAIKITIGPKGRNVVFSRGYGSPVVTNDGVSIAREISLKDKIENMGADIIKEVSQKTNDVAGDGTTTATVLTQAMMTAGMKELDKGTNVISLKKGMEKGAELAISILKGRATSINTPEETIQVATLSAESSEIGKVISDTVSKLGTKTVITVEESPVVGITSEVSQGMDFERGYISPYMITSSESMEAEYKNVPILVTDIKIAAVQEMLPLLESLLGAGKKDLVIIAEDVIGDALSTFIVNKMRGLFNVLAIKAPGFGNRKADYLQDIAIVTGAKYISADTGSKLMDTKIEDLGMAEHVISTKDKTTIVGGGGDKEALKNRILSAKKELETLESKHDKDKVNERIGKMEGGVAVIKVGAHTETETKYLKLKVEDAVSAVQAALEEGIIAGGGSTLVYVAEKMKDMINEQPSDLSDGEEVGYNILVESLFAPLRQIAINCGKEKVEDLIETVKKMSVKNGGYNALTDSFLEDMVKEGIIDPVKVTRSAIQNAVSAAATLLTAEVAIADEPVDKSELDK